MRNEHDLVPYVFSDQYDVRMEYSGCARAWDGVVFRDNPARREFIAFWMVGDRVVAGTADPGVPPATLAPIEDGATP
jgi:3-phenylpropionate/trans-cinnamate dioxygenase ferredoxin reductase subunit